MRMDRLTRRLAFVAGSAVAVGAALPAAAGAQGFGLNEIGTCSVGRAGAGVGSPCRDASAIFWNPAAPATALDRWTLLVGVAPVLVNGTFTQDTTGREHKSDVPPEFPPHLFVNYSGRLNRWGVNRFGAGLGIYVPYGLTSQWKQDFPGRFLAQKASLQTIYVQPNLSLEIVPDRFSIGGGPVFGYSHVELRQGIDLSEQPLPSTAVPPGTTFGHIGVADNTEFARAQIEASATAWGFHAGAHARLTDDLQLGARLLAALYFEYDGDATFEQVMTGLRVAAANPLGAPAGASLDDLLAGQFAGSGRLVSQGGKTQIKHPAQLQLGVAYTGFERTVVNLDYAMIRWTAFDVLNGQFDDPALSRQLFEHYENSHALRASVERTYLSGLQSRLGYHYVKTPAPDETVTPLLPDQDRHNFGIGLTIPFAGKYGFDISYLKVLTPGRRGRIVERATLDETADVLNGGWYALNANIFSFSLRAQF